jgi:hypothetical protein
MHCWLLKMKLYWGRGCMMLTVIAFCGWGQVKDLLMHWMVDWWLCLLPDAGNAPGNFDLVVMNHSLDKAYASLREFVVRELGNDKVDGESSCTPGSRSAVYCSVGSFIYQAMRWLGKGGLHKGWKVNGGPYIGHFLTLSSLKAPQNNDL